MSGIKDINVSLVLSPTASSNASRGLQETNQPPVIPVCVCLSLSDITLVWLMVLYSSLTLLSFPNCSNLKGFEFIVLQLITSLALQGHRRRPPWDKADEQSSLMQTSSLHPTYYYEKNTESLLIYDFSVRQAGKILSLHWCATKAHNNPFWTW